MRTSWREELAWAAGFFDGEKAEGTLVHILPRSECYVDSHVLGCFMPVTILSYPEYWRLIDPFDDYVEEVLNYSRG